MAMGMDGRHKYRPVDNGLCPPSGTYSWQVAIARIAGIMVGR